MLCPKIATSLADYCLSVPDYDWCRSNSSFFWDFYSNSSHSRLLNPGTVGNSSPPRLSFFLRGVCWMPVVIPTPMGFPDILLSPRIASAEFVPWKCCLHVLDFSLQNAELKLPRKAECFGVGFWNVAIKVRGLVPLPVNSIARSYIKAAPSLCMAWFRDSIKGKH